MTTAPLSVVVVDDERLARLRLRRLLGELPHVQVVADCDSGVDAADAVTRLAPDLVLLDVQMPGLDGFGVLDRLANVTPPPLVVFVTAFDEYAVRAFDVRAADYVLKPVDAARLSAAVDRARTLRDTARAAAIADSGARPAPLGDRIFVKDRGRSVVVRVAEIDYVEALGNYARIHAGARRHLLRERISALAERLAPFGFARVHRSAVVNLDRVREIVPRRTGDHVVVLSTGTRLKLSRSYREGVEAHVEPR